MVGGTPQAALDANFLGLPQWWAERRSQRLMLIYWILQCSTCLRAAMAPLNMTQQTTTPYLQKTGGAEGGQKGSDSNQTSSVILYNLFIYDHLFMRLH